MRHTLLTILAAMTLISCSTTATQTPQPEANANTQNPIMPIVFTGEDTHVVLTDYLPALEADDQVLLSTEPSYQVSNVTAEGFTLDGDHTLSVLSVDVPNKGLHYDIPIVPQSQYEVGLTTKSFTDSTITCIHGKAKCLLLTIHNLLNAHCFIEVACIIVRSHTSTDINRCARRRNSVNSK